MENAIMLKIESFIKNVEEDKNIINLNPRIDNGEYNGKFILVNNSPVYGTKELGRTGWKKAFIKMNLTHLESGKSFNDVEVSYNPGLKVLLLNDGFWSQQFGARAYLRTSKASGNEYQVIEFINGDLNSGD